MCNACGNQCCGSDEFEGCGCESCGELDCLRLCGRCGENECDGHCADNNFELDLGDLGGPAQ